MLYFSFKDIIYKKVLNFSYRFICLALISRRGLRLYLNLKKEKKIVCSVKLSFLISFSLYCIELYNTKNMRVCVKLSRTPFTINHSFLLYIKENIYIYKLCTEH